MAVSTKFIPRTQSSSNESEFPIMLQIIIDRKNQLVVTRKYSMEYRKKTSVDHLAMIV